MVLIMHIRYQVVIDFIELITLWRVFHYRLENIPSITGMSAPAWNRVEPSRLLVFRITAPNAKPRKNIMTKKIRKTGEYVSPK